LAHARSGMRFKSAGARCNGRGHPNVMGAPLPDFAFHAGDEERRGSKPALVLGLVFAVVGLGLLAGSWLTYRTERSRLKNWIRTVGVVTGLEAKRSKVEDGSRVTYAPNVEFVLPSGEVHHFIGSVSSNPPSYAEGENVRVLYNSQRPSEADIDSFMTHWFAPLCFLGMGIVFLLVGAYHTFGAMKEIGIAVPGLTSFN
jgi:hypothetical protein